jgi:hypothetical protein
MDKTQARKSALKSMSEEMRKMMHEGSEIESPMKVTVASDSQEGLKKGLSMADKIMQGKLGESASLEKPIVEKFERVKKPIDESLGEEDSDEENEEGELELPESEPSDEIEKLKKQIELLQSKVKA